jgi:hypothetical protein
VTLLNPLDGSELRPKSVKIDDAPIWMRGSKVLVQRVAATGRILEMKDILRDEVVWTKTVVTNSLITSVNEDDIAVLEQVDKESNLTLIRRADGIERYHVRLAYPANELIATRLIIQRDRDRDTILVGTPSKQIGNVRVFPVDFTASGSTPIDGLLASVDRREGKIVWSHAIEQACVVRQSVEQLPVLLLAVRLYDPAGAVGNPFSSGQQRLFARVIDKRSGRTIYSTNEVAIFSSNAPIRMVPQSDTRQITAEFNDWQLKLAFGMVGNAAQTERKPE